MTEAPKADSEKKPVAEHLEDLRICLIRSVAAIAIAAVGGYLVSNPLLEWLTHPIREEIGRLYFFSPADAFLVKLKIALLAGVVIASPVVFSQIWIYVAPGLYPREKKTLLPWLLFSWLLFLTGAAFAFKIVMPIALHFLIGFQTSFLAPMISISNYISFASSLILAFGIAFNMPVFILAFVTAGLLQTQTLTRYRRHAYVTVFILAMILTPPDMVSQILLALPLVLLYEISVVGAKIVARSKSS